MTNPMTLPRSKQDAGHPPSAHPEFVSALARAWFDEAETKGFDLERAIPAAGPYRASFASKRCDRELWYSMNDVPESNPPGIATHWGFAMGHYVHEALQGAINKIHPYSRSEVDVDLNVIGIPGSAHADLVTYFPCDTCGGAGVLPLQDDMGETCVLCSGSGLGDCDAVIEIKSVNATGFATMCTRDRGAPEGPRSGHVMQAAMVGAALGARRVVIIYMALENFSNWRHKRFAFDQSDTGKFTAEFEFPMVGLLASVKEEARRIKWVNAQPVRPPRRINDVELPVGSIITDPNPPSGNAIYHVDPEYDEAGRLSDFRGMGTWWFCAQYCGHRDQCVKDGA
jgi:hypothetical protein